MLSLPFVASLLQRIFELVSSLVGDNDTVIAVFQSLIEFFGG